MNINATLFVQAGNFFIAYFLFRYILLKPGYQALQEKKTYQASLEDTVAHDKRAVEKERQNQKDAWITFRKWCGEYRPSFIHPIFFFRGIISSVVPKKISINQRERAHDQLIKAMMTTLKERYER
jgi:hypothetical protein